MDYPVSLVLGSLLLVAVAFFFWKIHEISKDRDSMQNSLREVTSKLNYLRGEIDKKESQLKADRAHIGQKSSVIFLKIKDVISSLDPDLVGQNALDIALRYLGAVKAQLFIRSGDGRSLRLMNSVGEKPGGKRAELVSFDDKCMLTFAAEHKIPLFVDKVKQEQSLAGLVNKGEYKSAMVAPLLFRAKDLLIGVLNIETSNKQITNDDRHLFTLLASVVEMALFNASVFNEARSEGTRIQKEMEDVKNIASLYISSKVMDDILKDPRKIELGGQNKDVVLLVTDVRAFSKMSENLTASQLVEILNDYFTIMGQIVEEHGGYLDKFIGDAMMVIFGIPERGKNDEMAAVRAAQEMQKACHEFELMWQASLGFEFEFKMGIGISSGNVVVGNIGSLIKMDYTAIGDNVNTAFRLEANCPGGKIFITDVVQKRISYEIETIPLGEIKVKGKEIPVMTFEVA